MEGMTSITGAQYGFVARRILVDDQDSAVEMPPIGEPGSCLLGIAFYYNDGAEIKNLHRDYKYLAYGAPCHHMKHDKVFLIPNGLPKFITNNPNNFPFPTEAYLGIPLFVEGKCVGHFGMMWTDKGLEKLRLGWAYIEMLLHSLEDIILERIVEGQGYAKDPEMNKVAKVIPSEAVTAAQSLKPYARSLSHELRTPMQGVVGMLDVMYATVQESLEGQKDAVVRKVLKTLRENIEVVQGPSKQTATNSDRFTLTLSQIAHGELLRLPTTWYTPTISICKYQTPLFPQMMTIAWTGCQHWLQLPRANLYLKEERAFSFAEASGKEQAILKSRPLLQRRNIGISNRHAHLRKKEMYRPTQRH